MSAHEHPAPEKTNPVIWTLALVAFVAVVAWWFASMFRGGVHHAHQHPFVAVTGPTGPGEPDHATLISALGDQDADLLKLGRQVYTANCTACHGADGGKGINPAARAFIDQALLNGSDPYSMYLTLKKGFNAMPPQGGLSAEEKYAVIHYVREAFFQPSNPDQYVPVTPEYLVGGGPQGPFPAPGGGAGAAVARGADFVLQAPVAGAMDRRSEMLDAARVTAARSRLSAVAAQAEPDVAAALRALAGDENAGAFALALVATAQRGDVAALVDLLADPVRNRFHPALVLMPKDRLAKLATALQEGR